MMGDLYIKEIRREMNEGTNQDDYPFCLPVIRHLDRLALRKPVTFFVGENGMGKSTLLEAVAIQYGFNPEGGSKNFHFATAETHSDLYEHLRLVKGVRRPRDGYFLRAESFYNVISEIDREGLVDSYGGSSLHAQSHGEGFWTLVMERFYGNGLYLLDEPEAALSPSRQMALLRRIDELVQQNSQFLIATHSPILLAYPNADIYVLSADGFILTDYRETDHYQITKRFLDNPESMLRILLEE